MSFVCPSSWNLYCPMDAIGMRIANIPLDISKYDVNGPLDVDVLSGISLKIFECYYITVQCLYEEMSIKIAHTWYPWLLCMFYEWKNENVLTMNQMFMLWFRLCKLYRIKKCLAVLQNFKLLFKFWLHLSY